MTPSALAELLNDSQYPFRLSPDQTAIAKQFRLVVVYGASDDLMELEGAIYDEVSAPALAFVDTQGLLPDFNTLVSDSQVDKDQLRAYFEREPKGVAIESLWCSDDVYSWIIKTTIPHATFNIREDDDFFCRGIVFSLSDAVKPATGC